MQNQEGETQDKFLHKDLISPNQERLQTNTAKFRI